MSGQRWALYDLVHTAKGTSNEIEIGNACEACWTIGNTFPDIPFENLSEIAKTDSDVGKSVVEARVALQSGRACAPEQCQDGVQIEQGTVRRWMVLNEAELRQAGQLVKLCAYHKHSLPTAQVICESDISMEETVYCFPPTGDPRYREYSVSMKKISFALTADMPDGKHLWKGQAKAQLKHTATKHLTNAKFSGLLTKTQAATNAPSAIMTFSEWLLGLAAPSGGGLESPPPAATTHVADSPPCQFVGAAAGAMLSPAHRCAFFYSKTAPWCDCSCDPPSHPPSHSHNPRETPWRIPRRIPQRIPRGIPRKIPLRIPGGPPRLEGIPH